MTASAPDSTDPAAVGNAEDRERQTLIELLKRPRYEVLALDGTADQVEEHVPELLPVTVTASPRRGQEPTLTLTEDLARRGYSAVPHLAARLIYDAKHLADILSRLDEAGVRDVFVVAGDGDPPVGDFADSLQLLTDVERLRESGVGRSLTVGVAGYPEGHPLVSDDELARALLAKQPVSSYVVTQMCFDAGAIDRWIGQTRALGVTLPVYVGVAGAVDGVRLLRIAGRIGVGASTRFLRKHRGGARLLRPGGYVPDGLLDELASDAIPENRAIAGVHVYTFGAVAATERWRRELFDRLTDGEHPNG